MNKYRRLSLQELVNIWNKKNKLTRHNTAIFRKDHNYNKTLKLFSLLDINDKITNSKGTSIPAQYERYSDNDSHHNRYGFTQRIKQRSESNKKEAIKKMVRSNSDIGENIQIYSSKKNSIKLTKELAIKKNKAEVKKDSQFPKGFDSYELLIKNHKLYKEKIKLLNSLEKKALSPKQMKLNEIKSDIFFFKPPSEKESPHKYILRNNDYCISDIFNTKNDSKNLSKSGETYLFRNDNRIKYNTLSESNSLWKLADNKMPGLTNYSSKEYNIINPERKGITFTKEKILNECENKKDNVGYMNPIFKKKGLTEFIELTRNGAINRLKNYVITYNKNPKCFYKNNNMCTSLYNIHSQYNNICEKPFSKNFFN